jgi:hypothetical protein
LDHSTPAPGDDAMRTSFGTTPFSTHAAWNVPSLAAERSASIGSAKLSALAASNPNPPTLRACNCAGLPVR